MSESCLSGEARSTKHININTDAHVQAYDKSSVRVLFTANDIDLYRVKNNIISVCVRVKYVCRFK